MPLAFAPTNEATVRVLTANGCDVVLPRAQRCCPRRLVGQNATRAGQSVEQLDRLDLVRVGETPSRQRKQAEQPRVP